MKNLLKKLIKEAIISTSPEYMKKELVRSELQKLIKHNISKGKIKSQQDLEDYLNSVQLAITALKMIPLEIWKKAG